MSKHPYHERRTRSLEAEVARLTKERDEARAEAEGHLVTVNELAELNERLLREREAALADMEAAIGQNSALCDERDAAVCERDELKMRCDALLAGVTDDSSDA